MAIPILIIAQGKVMLGGAVAAVVVLWDMGRVAPDAVGAWTLCPLVVHGEAERRDSILVFAIA